ncbi:MAG: WG repeat-containing protein [Lachnospiraceae bacterium]|nr:WG repeat-containing protein [Lachnospiraceae bacterium]
MKSGINKAACILLFVFLTGCGREEILMEAENEELVSVSAETEDEKPVSVPEKTEEVEDTLNEAAAQYPMIATPSDAKWLDLVIVSEDTYCIFDGKEEKYGFLAEDGKEITPCIYDIAYPFSEGLACVCKDGKYGYINSEGETVLPFDYDRATPFVEGVAYFAIGESYGFMDKTGTPVLFFECDSISSFQEGLAYYSIDGRYGYVDQSGQVAIEPQFDDAGYFQNGLAKVMKNGRYGVINRDGELVVDTDYDYITTDGSFIITKSDENYSCFDSTGKVLIEQSDYIYTPEGEEYICFRREGKRGLIDIKGNILIEPMYGWISSLQTPEQNLLIVEKDELFGVVDLQGEIKIPVMYNEIEYDRYVDSAEGGMFLLTDADGNIESVDAADFSEKIPCSYDGINWLSKDRAVVSKDGLRGIIDREGNIIEPIEYDVLGFFADGAVWIKKGMETCFYNSSGEKAEGSYDYDSIVKEGNCYRTEKDDKYGFLNELGEEVVSPVYDHLLDYEVCGCSFNVYIVTDYDSDVWNSIIKTGEPEWVDLSEVLLHNEITPRIGLYHEFIKSGSVYVEDMDSHDRSVGLEDLKDCKKTYKLYDLDHSGEPILYFDAEPYKYNNFPESYSGFYAIRDNQLVELVTGYECGGSSRGDYVCFWYDRETSQVFPGTGGASGGFGGYVYWGTVCDRKGGEMLNIASFEHLTQWISNYSEETLAHAELFYDGDDEPYTKETLAQAKEEEGSAQTFFVNGVQTTIEEYLKMEDRYQRLTFME